MSSPFHKPLRLAAIATSLAFGASAAAKPPTEYEIKAVYLFHFTEFVLWPEVAFPAPNSPFVIGIVGDDPFGDALTEAVRQESVGTHPIEIRRVDDLAAERRCQILFVAKGAEGRLRPQQLRDSPVLIVGESGNSTADSAIVEFVTEHNHVHVKIDLAQARAHGLLVSAKLLRVAEVTSAHPPVPEN